MFLVCSRNLGKICLIHLNSEFGIEKIIYDISNLLSFEKILFESLGKPQTIGDLIKILITTGKY